MPVATAALSDSQLPPTFGMSSRLVSKGCNLGEMPRDSLPITIAADGVISLFLISSPSRTAP